MLFALGALMNGVRGGQWKAWLGYPPNEDGAAGSDLMNELVFGLVVMFLSGNPLLGAAAAIAMALGARPGWGDYIGAMIGNPDDELKENKIIDYIIRPLEHNPFWWGFVGLTIRGFWWCSCLAATFFLFGYHETALEFMLRAPFMAATYWLAIKWMKTRVGQPGHGWGLGELFWGAVLWNSL